MAKRTINLGTSANKGDGDPLRTAFTKINDNFTEVYGLLGADEVDTDDVIAPMLVHNNHVNVVVTRDDDADQIIFTVDQAVTDLQGSVYGDDSTLLVDGVNSSINLDGTVKGNIIPDANVAYDLGSASKRFRDIYLSGSTIDLGGLEISNVGGELQLGGVKIITQSELDVAVQNDITTNLTGSVFADDSTLLVDGVAGKIVGDVENSIVYTDIVYARSSDLYVNADDQASLYLGATNSQTIIIGASDSTIYLNGNQDSLVGAGKFFSPRGTDLNIATLDMTTGSADAIIIKGGETSDSDLSAFGGNVKINAGRNSNALQQHGDIQIGTEFTNGVTIGTYDGGDGFGNTVSLAGYTVIVGNSNNLSNIQLKGNVDFSDAKVSNLDVELSGDLSGSVFGDDSTLLVDGVNGVIPTSVLEGDITNPIRTGDVVIESTTSPGSITLTQTGIGNISLSATAIDFNNSPIENFLLSYITSGLTAPGSSVVAGETAINFNFSGVGTKLTVEQDAITIGSGVTVSGFVGDITGDLTGSVFADDSTLLVDGVAGKIVGDVDITGGNRIDLDTDSGFYITNTDINIYGLTVAYTSNLNQLTASGAVSLASTLSVTGNTALGGNLDVAGDSSTTGNSTVAGNESIAGTLGVTGNTTLSGDAAVGGNLAIAGDLDVAGDTTLEGTVDLSSATVTGLPYATITNEVGGSASLAVGSVMSVDYLNVRLIDKGTTLGVEFNYDPADFTSVIDAYSDDTSVGNVFNGSSNVTVGNTVWTEVTTLGTIGDRITFTLTDHSSHRVYRATVTMRTVPDGGTLGSAYAIIETLK